MAERAGQHDTAAGAGIASTAPARADQVGPLPADRAGFIYKWPPTGQTLSAPWLHADDGRLLAREMPETADQLALDSRWPALFPSGICLVTASDGQTAVLEKVVGASIVNRFPYVMALSFCREPLSDRHYARSKTMEVIEAAERVSVQFIMPGDALARTMAAIAQTPESDMATRLDRAGGAIRTSRNSDAPILDAAYLVYEGRLVRPGKDFDGARVHQLPWIDCGSHRIYNFEIETIALAQDIADGVTPLHWRSLPVWRNGPEVGSAFDPDAARRRAAVMQRVNYTKTYRSDYVFPSKDTVAFAGTPGPDGFSVLDLPPLPADQVEVENDRARWPCFFPSSIGMITSEDRNGRRAAFPCGSTMVVARRPMTIGICVSYARINERYAPRASLDIIRDAGRFVCGVPILRPDVLAAIGYLGNVSLRDDPDKAANSGLEPMALETGFAFRELPVNFDCRVVEAIQLGTHTMFMGVVERILLDARLTDRAPLEWCPWAGYTAPLPIADGD
jgi:flavin reductase (DIM6/NTAB) family NADH-FMN oxidoreductase RutF